MHRVCNLEAVDPVSDTGTAPAHRKCRLLDIQTADIFPCVPICLSRPGQEGFSLLQNVQTGSAAHPIGTVILSRRKSGRGVKLSSDLHITLRLRSTGAVPLHPLYAFMVWTGTQIFLLLHKIRGPGVA